MSTRSLLDFPPYYCASQNGDTRLSSFMRMVHERLPDEGHQALLPSKTCMLRVVFMSPYFSDVSLPADPLPK